MPIYFMTHAPRPPREGARGMPAEQCEGPGRSYAPIPKTLFIHKEGPSVKRGRAWSLAASLVVCGMAIEARAQLYSMTWYTVDGGGHMFSSGGSYVLGATIGQPDAGTTMTGGTYSLSGGFWPGAEDTGCTNGEKIKKAGCKLANDGSRQLKVSLVGGRPGDGFVIRLTDGSEKSGTINSKGKGKGVFKNRPPGDTGTATAAWDCGAMDSKNYTCP